MPDLPKKAEQTFTKFIQEGTEPFDENYLRTLAGMPGSPAVPTSFSTVSASTQATIDQLASLLQQKRQQRSEIDQQIQEIGGALNTLSRVFGVIPPTTAPEALGPNAFLGMKVPDAIAAYFRVRGNPATLNEIANGLLAGGIAHASTDFPNTVYMALRRGPFSRFDKKWGLSEWQDQLLKGGSFKPEPSIPPVRGTGHTKKVREANRGR